jgi:hypothetical protein
MTGFLSTDKVFSNVSPDVDSATSLVVFDNIEPDGRYENFRNDTTSFYRVFRSEKGQAWSEIYARKPNQ